jgi:hypothetical protein
MEMELDLILMRLGFNFDRKDCSWKWFQDWIGGSIKILKNSNLKSKVLFKIKN